jgi:hypothetical protein
MFAVSLAMALAVFDTGAFLAGAFAAGFAAFAGAVTFFVVVAALGATFFAVAICVPILLSGQTFLPGKYCPQYFDALKLTCRL